MKRFSFRIYFLLIIPVVLAVLALCGFGFIFKSGTALAGIFILYFLHYNRFKHFKDVWMIIAAFIFSIAGDWFLSNKQDSAKMFAIGIALFFFAHLSYLVFALMNGKVNWRFTFIILTAYLVFYFLVLFPAFDNEVLKWTALVYLLISCFSLGAAVGINLKHWIKWSYIFGIFLILFSDTIISLNEFVGYKQLNYLILPTYYIAHISITISLMIRISYWQVKKF